MLGNLEQEPMYNSVNFSINMQHAANQTAYATGLSTLWCPSDATISRVVNAGPYEGLTNWYARFTSYGGVLRHVLAGDRPLLERDDRQ